LRARLRPARVRAGLRRRADALLRKVAERISVPVVEPVAERLAATEAELARTRADLASVAVDVHALQPSVQEQLDSNRINLELLKGEFRELLAQVEELGMAFAPATGLAGAGARFAELREAVNGLERRIRNQALVAGSAGGASAEPSTDADVPPTVGVSDDKSSALFNYVGFERRFRGDPDEILDTLDQRYAELLAAHQPIVDVGCGRGELLDRLAARGLEVVGVEPDSGMVADARDRGLTVHQMFAGDYLRSVPDRSIGAIISTHVVEHLRLDHLIEFIELSERKLAPGGIFVAETPNPSSLIVLGNSYIMDPTHVWPLHPSLLAFLAESAGFRDVRLNFYSPALDYQLKPLDASTADENLRSLVDQINADFARLNDVLFGPQDYAIIATTAPAGQAPQ
jgi:SAM-dependent methyltransferase